MNQYRLRLDSKKLESGRYQVKFTTEGIGEGYYGYLLTESQTSVSEVVSKISRHLLAIRNADKYLMRNLYSLGKREVNSGRILIFRK